MALLHHSRIRACFLAFVLLWLTPAWSFAQMTLELTVSGSEAQSTEFSLEDLDALDQAEFTTSTIWTDGPVTFSGVPLKTLLATIQADGTAIEMVALNDYKVVMPLSDVESDVPIIATRMNGAPMSVRYKGPYWIVFPYDQDARYQTETIYSYSIWQLNRLNVVD